jgi:hypothetical protein
MPSTLPFVSAGLVGLVTIVAGSPCVFNDAQVGLHAAIEDAARLTAEDIHDRQAVPSASASWRSSSSPADEVVQE